MQDGLQPPPRVGVSEDDGAQALSVEPPVAGKQCLWPQPRDLGQRRLPGLDRLARQLIGVDDWNSPFGDEARHRRLSRGDAAGQPDELQNRNPRRVPRAPKPLRMATDATLKPMPGESAPRSPEVLAATFVAEARDLRGLPPAGAPEIAFAGRSNVGKSTLLNRLAGRRALARTSKTPGRTRGIVFFDLELARPEPPLRFVDLPGYGYARVARDERDSWQALIEGYAQGRQTLAMFAVLVDARRGVDDEERQLYEWLGTINVPAQVVITKVDKLSATERGRLRAETQKIFKQRGPRRAVPILASGESGEGVGELWAAIRDAARAITTGAGEFAGARGPA